MKLVYSLDENDFLQHLLFMASKSTIVKNKRIRNQILVTAFFAGAGFLFYLGGSIFMLYNCAFVSILSLLFYPLYERIYYKKHYQTFIAATCKNRFGSRSTIIFTDTNIETFDKTGESKINLSEIEEITETGNYFYVQMRSGGSLIIPKYKIEAVDNLRMQLQKLAEKLNILFAQNLNWKWK